MADNENRKEVDVLNEEALARERLRNPWHGGLGPIELAEPEIPPAINSCLLCARCDATYRILEYKPRIVDPPTMYLLPSSDRERDASAEIPFCPAGRPTARRVSRSRASLSWEGCW